MGRSIFLCLPCPCCIKLRHGFSAIRNTVLKAHIFTTTISKIRTSHLEIFPNPLFFTACNSLSAGSSEGSASQLFQRLGTVMSLKPGPSSQPPGERAGRHCAVCRPPPRPAHIKILRPREQSPISQQPRRQYSLLAVHYTDKARISSSELAV